MSTKIDWLATLANKCNFMQTQLFPRAQHVGSTIHLGVSPLLCRLQNVTIMDKVLLSDYTNVYCYNYGYMIIYIYCYQGHGYIFIMVMCIYHLLMFAFVITRSILLFNLTIDILLLWLSIYINIKVIQPMTQFFITTMDIC